MTSKIRLLFWCMLLTAVFPLLSGYAEQPSGVKSNNIPVGYEMPERGVSPSGEFAVLFPLAKNHTAKGDHPANLLVRLNPFHVLAKVCEPGLPQHVTTSLEVEWYGESLVAIYEFRKWGIVDLSVYEIENGKIKRVHPVWKEARKLFERDIRARLLQKYPKEDSTFFFVSDEGEENPRRDFHFQDRKVLLDIFADNRPSGAGGPHWSARLLAAWNLNTAKLENVDFRPGKVSIRPEP